MSNKAQAAKKGEEMNEEIKITVMKADIEIAIHAICDLAGSLSSSAFFWTCEGAFQTAAKSCNENAVDWMQEHYDTAAAAVRLIHATASLISAGLANDEIAIAEGEHPWNKWNK